MPKRDMRTECWSCDHKRAVPGNAHIRCVNPPPKMTGHEHGVVNGWFNFPWLFDPTWKTKLCTNYTATREEKEPGDD